jgi:Protein of unknown function (DUF3634)
LELILELGLVILGAVVIYAAWRPRCAFVVRITDGAPRVAKGTVTKAFVQEIGETCKRHSVQNGVVRGVVQGRRIALGFSRGLPPPCRQQLRNLWAISGWSAGPDVPRARR